MGRKRKVVHTIAEAVQGSATGKEDTTSCACPETATAEELDVHTNKTSGTEVMNDKNDMQANSNDLPPTTKVVVVRRSLRLRSSGSTLVNPIVEHVNLVEKEKEEEPNRQQVRTLPVLGEKNLEQEPQVEQANTVHNVNERNLEEKINYLVQAVDEFKTKVFGRPKEDFSYKSLYIDAQKKIEALMEENYELVKKLEFALGKVEAYEMMKDAVGASREVILVSDLAKATEVCLSPQTVQNRIPTTAAPGTAKSKRNKKKLK